MGLWRESEAFLLPPRPALIFENSTACENDEASRPQFSVDRRLRRPPARSRAGETAFPVDSVVPDHTGASEETELKLEGRHTFAGGS